MSKLFILVTALLTFIFVYRRLYYKRFAQYAKFPQLPSSLLFGHLKIYDEITKRGAVDRDNDDVFLEIYQSLGRPSLVLMDYRPICRPVVFIASHEMAEQISKATKLFPTSAPKFDLSHLEPVIGPTSILSAYGEEWRLLRKSFNHGFSLQHLLTLIPTMANKTMVFVRQLDTLSKTGNKFSLVSLSMHLTFDIIGSVIMDVDLNAQDVDPSQRSELVRLFTKLLDAYWDDQIHIPWWLKIRTVLRRRRLGRRVERILKSIIRRKYEEQQANLNNNHGQQLSILCLSLQNTKILSPDILDLTCDQLKTFLLAGHDTPSATIAWIFYELSRNSRALTAVRSELDDIFGPRTEPEGIYAQLISPAGADLVGRMLYTMAVIKETLRLHTPASTARYSAAGTGLTIHTPTGDELCVDDMVVYNCSAIIHRDPAIYGDTADHFMPERWLSGAQSTTPVPCGAWRPFERGPRGCIGQEFASIEIRVLIAMIARRYEFTKVGLGELVLTEEDRCPIVGDDGGYKVRSHLYNVSSQIPSSQMMMDARPVDGMMMTVEDIGEPKRHRK
ncbi:hypothetical protein E0Z10_g9790 [Xylaria hypoxylon]|uniref:Cytochrome P450 n=1 Tax=Xylaria hypoxylon TaxID=37992 RepID=A0A4Z0YQW2_9PEZI|nr:hypothetical protein E0Z10_g9790 [Xylaria hypoxylon]